MATTTTERMRKGANSRMFLDVWFISLDGTFAFYADVTIQSERTMRILSECIFIRILLPKKIRHKNIVV